MQPNVNRSLRLLRANAHRRGWWLKWTRVAVGVAMLSLCTLMLVTLSGSLAVKLGWVAKIQIMPLALGASLGALAVWIAVTLIFGRLYCSTICPLGVMQDVFSRFRRLTGSQRRRNGYRYNRGYVIIRLEVFAIVIVSLIVGFTVVPSLLDPYSAYGRISTELLSPLVEWLGGREVLVPSVLAFLVALATLVGIGAAALWRGRLFCNTLCPVGTGLGAFSKYSLFHFDIDTDVCVNCRACERVCKAECISMADHVVDGSRCVACFNCVNVCSANAIRYTTDRKRLSLPMMQKIQTSAAASSASFDTSQPITSHKNPNETAVKIDRRQFLATGLLLAASPALVAVTRGAKRVEAIEKGQTPFEPQRAVAPPGRVSMRDYLLKCTGCGLCVAHCPKKVLRPSSNELGWFNMLHPVMDYDSSYCLYDCTECTDLCPTKALEPLSVAEKHIFVVGHARTEQLNCIGCGRCVRICPRKAVQLLPRTKGEGSRLVAAVETSACIGCGACQWVCPVGPYKAIVVDGIS